MWHKDPRTRFVEPGDKGFWMGLWKSDAFRSLLEDPRTGYAAALERAAELPWWFVEPTQDYERRHFTVWFAHTFVNRTYENPVISDLFYWHDLLHALTFADSSLRDFDGWKQSMRANEIAVSLETEILIYRRQPALRNLAFPHPIWQDRLAPPLTSDLTERLGLFRQDMANHPADFQKEKALRQEVPANWPVPDPDDNGLSFDDLWDLRRAVTRRSRKEDALEQTMVDYEAQAVPFYETWRTHWKEVETERQQFLQANKDGRWREAVHRRTALWERRCNADGIPYGDMAQALVKVGF